MGHKVRRHQMDNALMLLQAAAKHPTGEQTVKVLSALSGVSETTVDRLLTDARGDKFGSILMRAACKYRFDFVTYAPRSTRRLDAIYRGYGNDG